MLKKKIVSVLAKCLLFIIVLATFSAYADDNLGSIKVFCIDGLSVNLYQIGVYDSDDNFIKNTNFNDLSSIEAKEIERYLASHQNIKGTVYHASDGEFVMSGMEKGVYFLKLVPNSKYRMNSILIEMPMKLSESNTQEWFYEIEPKFELVSPKPLNPGTQMPEKEETDRDPIKEDLDDSPIIQINESESPKDNLFFQDDKGNIHLSQTGDSFNFVIVIFVLGLSLSYIIWYLRKKKK